jgi:hypothetical protein
MPTIEPRGLLPGVVTVTYLEGKMDERAVVTTSRGLRIWLVWSPLAREQEDLWVDRKHHRPVTGNWGAAADDERPQER